jgi:peptidyl-prolyl cis-trans isomerase C
MKQQLILWALLAGATLLTACAQKDAATPAAATAEPAATIDGQPISKELFEFYAKNRVGKPLSELTPEQKQDALDELIRMKIAADAALKNGLDKNTETATRLELTRLNELANAAFQKHLGDQKPSEQELRAEYEKQIAEQPKLEYHARHILVATEQFAQSLIDKLNKGGNFAELARKESMDGSKSEGGDLGWFTPSRMVTPFAEAVVGLQKGEITQKPVQTQYGWHVIKLEDTREVTPPDFEQVKDRLGVIVQQNKLRAYVDELKKTAKIEKKI